VRVTVVENLADVSLAHEPDEQIGVLDDARCHTNTDAWMRSTSSELAGASAHRLFVRFGLVFAQGEYAGMSRRNIARREPR
jgi:hypothetical protein